MVESPWALLLLALGVYSYLGNSPKAVWSQQWSQLWMWLIQVIRRPYSPWERQRRKRMCNNLERLDFSIHAEVLLRDGELLNKECFTKEGNLWPPIWWPITFKKFFFILPRNLECCYFTAFSQKYILNALEETTSQIQLGRSSLWAFYNTWTLNPRKCIYNFAYNFRRSREFLGRSFIHILVICPHLY